MRPFDTLAVCPHRFFGLCVTPKSGDDLGPVLVSGFVSAERGRCSWKTDRLLASVSFLLVAGFILVGGRDEAVELR